MSEEMIIRHCSLTLAGIKTGNMFSCKYDSIYNMREDIRNLNIRLKNNGIRVLPLRFRNNNALIYIYRPLKLSIDLQNKIARNILKEYGYDYLRPNRCINKLIHKLDDNKVFPHEIGLFLGYPPVDVLGFINNKECKFVGFWKVYENENKAKKIFLKYQNCIDNYSFLYKNGNSLESLTVLK